MSEREEVTEKLGIRADVQWTGAAVRHRQLQPFGI